MMPDPLHPAVVHFPIVLASLLPVFAVGALLALKRGAAPRVAWGIVFALSLATTVSTLAAVKTGEDQEERVERVVPESAFEEHEEAGERLRVVAALVTLVMAGGFLNGRKGRAARWAGMVASVGLMAGAFQTGHSGGQLVYTHGAAEAYVSPSTAQPEATREAPSDELDERDTERRPNDE